MENISIRKSTMVSTKFVPEKMPTLEVSSGAMLVALYVPGTVLNANRVTRVRAVGNGRNGRWGSRSFRYYLLPGFDRFAYFGC